MDTQNTTTLNENNTTTDEKTNHTYRYTIVHGDKDNIVPFSMGKRMFESFSAPKFSYFKSGDDHMMDFDQELLGNIKNFINELN